MLKTKLILERLDKDHRILERREQLSRSFIKGFMELLYVQHAQLAPASGYNCTDVNKQLLPVDIYISVTPAYRYRCPNLMIGAPPGLSSAYLSHADITYRADNVLPGCELGIQVGLDNTAVTPTDYRLGQRLGHGRRAPDGAPLLFENYTAADNSDQTIYGANWGGQMFIPAITHRVTSVAVKIWKSGAPPDLNVVIRGYGKITTVAENDDPAPGTVNLASGTIAAAAIPGASPGALTTCAFATPVDLYAGHRYFIVLYLAGGDAGNNVKWRYNNPVGTGYTRAWSPRYGDFCERIYSIDTGVSWRPGRDQCQLFQEYGQSSGEFEYGGCELSNITFADPNGQFTIRRYFENHCGSAKTIQEVGITALGQVKFSSNAMLYSPFLIARDVVAPGIAVNDGELLRVTYVPQITV